MAAPLNPEPYMAPIMTFNLAWYQCTMGMQASHQLYLEGQGDLVSRLITLITHIVTPNSPIVNLVIKSP